MTPAEIRQSIRQQRRTMDSGERSLASQRICEAIIERGEFLGVARVAAFLAFDGEVDLTAAIEAAWDRGQQLLLPVVTGQGQPLKFAEYSSATKLVTNRFGILQPDTEPEQWVDGDQLDCVLTPLVAFDLALNRIGVGGGFYDRTFAFTKMSDVADRPVLIGVAFELQKLDAIVPKAWDVRLDLVVTEDAIYQAD